jgi:DNA-binding MarR family transcriptional regulator
MLLLVNNYDGLSIPQGKALMVMNIKLIKPSAPHRRAAAELLEFFYAVHYELGTGLEDVLRAGRLTRHQAAILWLIRSEGGAEFRLRRKDIESRMRNWFEVTSAAVSKSLREIMRPPLSLIEISEDPRSGREKLVALTPQGRQFVAATALQAQAFLAQLCARIALPLLDDASEFFRELTSAFHQGSPRRLISELQASAVSKAETGT